MKCQDKKHIIEVFVRRLGDGVFRPYGLLTSPPSSNRNRPFVRLFDPCENYRTIRAAFRGGMAFAVNVIDGDRV